MFPDAPISIPLYADLIIDGNSSRGIGVLQKLRRREFSAVAMASVVLAPGLALSAVTPQKVSIALAAKTSLFHLPLVLAEQLGAFKNEGLQIDWLECESGLQAVQFASAWLKLPRLCVAGQSAPNQCGLGHTKSACHEIIG
jgi:hypothetical protein